jgi:hypothetical protein
MGLDLGVSENKPEKYIEMGSPMLGKSIKMSTKSEGRSSSKLSSSLSATVNLSQSIYTPEMIAQRMNYLNSKSMQNLSLAYRNDIANQ